MSRSRTKAKASYSPQGELTIYRALEHFEALRAMRSARAAVLRLDLSGVSEIDSAGLQLLLLLRKSAAAEGGALCITSASAAVRELLEFCNLGALLADGDAAEKAA